MLFSGGGSVNTVSDGSLITKGLLLVQYKTAQERLLSAQNSVHDPRATARATPTFQNIQIQSFLKSSISRKTCYRLALCLLFLYTPQTLTDRNGQNRAGLI